MEGLVTILTGEGTVGFSDDAAGRVEARGGTTMAAVATVTGATIVLGFGGEGGEGCEAGAGAEGLAFSALDASHVGRWIPNLRLDRRKMSLT